MKKPKRTRWQDLNHNKSLQETCIIHEEIFLDKHSPTLNESVNQGAVHLNKLNELQYEVEKVLCSLTERSIFLDCEVRNRNLPEHFALIQKTKQANNNNINGNSNTNLSVKSNPEKPLTLIFSSPKESPLPAKKTRSCLPPYANLIMNNGHHSNGPHSFHNPHSHLLHRGSSKNQILNGSANNCLRSSRSTSKKLKSELVLNGEQECTTSISGEATHQNPVNLYAIPNKFWALMEPYCADISDNDVQVLQDMLKIYDSDAEYYKIPPLGTEHNLRGFGYQKFDCNEFANCNGNADRVDEKESTESDPTMILKRITSQIKRPMNEDSCLNSVCEAMMTNLFDDNIAKVMETSRQCSQDYLELSQLSSQPPKQLAKQLHVRNHFKIERNINQVSGYPAHLCPLGIALEDEDSLSSLWGNSDVSSHLSGSSTNHHLVDPEDEVLTRLRHRQSELRLVTEANVATLRRLQSEAKADMQRQEILRRLALADADVIEAYDKLDNYRTIRKPPLKRDRDSAWRCIKERKKVIKELDSFNAKG